MNPPVEDREAMQQIIEGAVFECFGENDTSWVFNFKKLAFSQSFLNLYAKIMLRHLELTFPHGFQLAGMETGALPLLSAIAMRATKQIPCFYIRKSRKKKGLMNNIEGTIDSNLPILLIDDILNSGNTYAKQISILKSYGHSVVAVYSIIQFKPLVFYTEQSIFKNINFYSLFELKDFATTLPFPDNTFSEKKEALTNPHLLDWGIRLAKPTYRFMQRKSAPVFNEGEIFAPSESGKMSCITSDTGTIIWNFTLPYLPFSLESKRIVYEPVVHGACIYFTAQNGNLYCLSKETGKLIWIYTEADIIFNKPCLHSSGKILFLGANFGLTKKCGSLIALSVATGTEIWKSETVQYRITSSPQFNKKYNIVLFGCEDGSVYCLNARNGTCLWTFKANATIPGEIVIDTKRELAIFGTLDGCMYCLSLKTGALYATFAGTFGFNSDPTIYKDSIIIGCLDGYVYCFNIETKSTSWCFLTNGRIFASPIILNDHVFIGSNDGILYELDAQTGACVSKTIFTERILDKVTFNPEKPREIYLLTQGSELYKISLHT